MRTGIRTAAAIVAAGTIAAGCGTATLASSGTPTTRAGTPSTTPTTAHATTSATASAQAATAEYVMLNCNSSPVVSPSTIVITCADAGIGAQDLHWTSWTPNLASGHGTFWENDCKPSCAGGHPQYYPSLEVLWGSAAVKGHPADERYTNLTVIFTGTSRPPVYVLSRGKPVATYPLTQTFPAI